MIKLPKRKDRDCFVQFVQNFQVGIRFSRTSDVTCGNTVTLRGFMFDIIKAKAISAFQG